MQLSKLKTLNRKKTTKNILISLLYLLFFLSVSPKEIYSYVCGEGKYCNPGDATEAVGDGVWRKVGGSCYDAKDSYSYKCTCGTPCNDKCYGGVGTFHYDSSCSGEGFYLGCCDVGSSTPPCVETCNTCTPATCPTGSQSNATANYTTIPACARSENDCTRYYECSPTTSCGSTDGWCYPIGACQNCTPSTPAGYHIPATEETTNTSLGEECSRDVTCDKLTLCSEADCGDVTNTFYRDERNTTNPASPTAPRMTIDGINFNLSTDSSVVTRIKKPLPTSAENTVFFSVTGITVNPSVAFGPYYDFSAENKGVSNAWLDDYDNCDGNYKEDFCYFRDTSTTKEFHSTITGHKTPTQILLEGAEGTVAFRSVSTDRCTSTSMYSPWTYPSYKVDYLPVVTDVLISGTPSNNRGCSPTVSFTGQVINKDLTITVKGTDADGVNDINGAVIWLVKEGTSIANDINKLTYFNAATPRTDGNKIGIFVRKSDSNSYVANIVSGNLSNWGNGPTVTSISNQEIITSITRNHYLGTGSDLGKYVFEITLTFSSSNNESSLISGQYNVYAALTDSLSYSNYIDQQNVVDSGRDWYFDFINPTIGAINTNIENAQQRLVDVTFTSSDNQGVIKDTVLNIYISSSPKEVLLINPIPTNGSLSQEPSSSPISPQPGLISPLLSGWYFDSQQQSFRINIQNNSSGNLTFYPTVYDRACNFVTSQSNAIDLNKWIVTKGGILFSSGNIGFSPKDISDDWNIGTEIIGIGSNLHPVKLDNGEERNPVSITNIIDRNNQNKTAFYDLLVERANLYKKKFNYPVYTEDMNLCLTQCASTIKKICVCQPTSDFTFSTDTTFNGKFLILTTKNINIQANLTPSSSDSALIILTSGKVNIGKVKSGVTSFGTDTINAFIISKGGIDILSEIDADPGIQQDQVVVNGGLIGLSDTGNAINILRNLGLMNISKPTLIVNYEPRYAKISELFFGTDTRVYKQEVGFKM